MATVKDSFLDLERHRQKLEEHVDNLIIALDEWRQWKEEYETLKADVKALPPSPSRSDLTRVRQEYEGELVNEKELIDIFRPGDSRKPEKIISTLTNRLDYVTRNIDTLTKQLEVAENRLATARVVSNPDATDEDGLPITEIMEELDEDDNVISYNLRRPGDSQPQLLEALKKAGIKDLPSGASKPVSEVPSDISQDTEQVPSNGVESEQTTQPEAKPAEEPTKAKAAPKKKGVTFSEDTKPAEEEKPSETASKLEEILRKAKEQQSIISDPVLPADESPEEASLREDMIRYNKETMEFEMAPIVAELQLEEGSTDGDFDSDDYDDADDDDDEDQWGRSTSGVVDDDWKLQMLELKERLSKHSFDEAKSNGNGEAEKDDDDDETGDGIGRIVVKHEKLAVSQDSINNQPASGSVTENSTAASDAKKSVRFAETLDVAEAHSAIAPAAKPPKQPDINPVSDVMERMASGTAKPAASAPPSKRPSRFRTGRATTTAKVPPPAPEKPVDPTRYAPSGPAGRTLAASVVERGPSSSSAGGAREPDELDANLLQQQVAEEYHRMRNRLVHRQGGFMKEDENPIQPLDEEEGGPRRVSRFKAARLAGS
ncbi:Prefoldin subunit-domain-containing protein [Biscogniauxia marginata]|nr:Prefoldin subunit-domain-containing protein [Biscogniauxia marginata]